MLNLLKESLNLMPGRARSHWSLEEQQYEDALMWAHKRAASEIHKVMGGKYSPIGSGWSTSVSFDHGVKLMRMEVGGNYLPRPDVYYVYFQVVGPSFDRSPELAALLKQAAQVTKRSLYSVLGRYGKTHKIKIENGIMMAGADIPEEGMPEFLTVVSGAARAWASALKRQVFEGATEGSFDEMSAAYARLDWKGAAKKLLAKRTGKGQDDLYYRAYMRAVIDGNSAQATHLAREYEAAREARRDLIDKMGVQESVDEGVAEGMPKRLRVTKGNKKFDIDKGVSLQVDKIEPFETGAKLVLMHLNGRRSGKKDVLWVRYMKHLKGRDTFNLAKGDGISKIVVQVTKRAEGAASESIAGAPGAFAVSDAPAPTPQDQVADLLDRVRNPRWEYPSWALPKVKLDEVAKPTGIDVASKGVGKALRRAKYFEGDAEKTTLSVAKAILQSKVVMEYLWGTPKHIRSESFLRDLIKFPIQKWLRSQDGHEDPEMEDLVDEVLPMLIPSARSDATTVRKHVRFAGMLEAIAGSKKHMSYPSDYPDNYHQTIVGLERKRLAEPLYKAAREMLVTHPTLARYMQGLAIATEKGRKEVQKEFWDKLPEVARKYVPITLRKDLEMQEAEEGSVWWKAAFGFGRIFFRASSASHARALAVKWGAKSGAGVPDVVKKTSEPKDLGRSGYFKQDGAVYVEQ